MPTKDEPRITLRLSAEVDAQLRATADAAGVKPGTWARKALEDALRPYTSNEPQIVAARNTPSDLKRQARQQQQAAGAERPLISPNKLRRFG